MQNIEHVVSVDYKPTFRTEKVAGLFDIPVAEKLQKSWSINISLDEKPWQIGLIIGSSGSGKTTIAKRLFGENNYHNGFNWDQSNLLDDFDESLSVKNITDALSHVGFSSPPAWLLPYRVLSNGQKFRAEVARCLIEPNNNFTVFDEFSSVVDRNVARVSSYAVSKYIRKTSKQFVAVTCHYDIEQYLQPDWVLDISINEFKWGSLRRPEFKLQIFQCDYKAWRLFAGNHYLNANINTSAKCFIAMLENEPVGFCALLPFPHPHKKNYWKEHRTVVLPDYQGIGIGNKLSEFCGDWLRARGKGYISITSHPAMIGYRSKSSKWVMTRKPSHTSVSNTKVQKKTACTSRLTASFEYIGN